MCYQNDKVALISTSKESEITNTVTTDKTKVVEKAPKVFISYSHEDESHQDWVLQLATRLRSNGIDVVLDRWNLNYGHNVASFMERGLSTANRVVSICSENYVRKADEGERGVGYEKQIITAEMMSNLNGNWVVPIIKNNPSKAIPSFLSGKLYIDFEKKLSYESNYEELLRELLEVPSLPIPPIGKNPFETAKYFAEQKFIPDSEKYVSPATKGRVTFDYSNNDGNYFIGQDELGFKLHFSKASNESIHLYKDPDSIKTVAIIKDRQSICDIDDARNYDSSSRVRTPKLNQIAIIQNMNGFFAAIKILHLKDDTRGDEFDEVTFEYSIQKNGSPDFTK